MTTQAVLSSLMLTSTLLLLPTSTRAAIESADTAGYYLHWVRNSTICAAVANTVRNSSLDELGQTPDPKFMFGKAEKLSLSECRHPHEFVIVQQGRYAFLSDTDVVASVLARNYRFTLCVNTEHRTNFSCYKNGATYFVAPSDYEKVLTRGPVGFYRCPQTFEALYGEHVSLIQDEHQCATYLTVSSYAVRTNSGDCVHLFRYALFKEYPEVWNGCQRYSKACTGKAFYDYQFNAAPEPWNYPTREEVSRCTDYAPRVPCSSVQFDSGADARYFYAGRGVGEMTQNKRHNESCQPPDDFIAAYGSAVWLVGSYYTPVAAIGGFCIILAAVVRAQRVVCRMFLCGRLCIREPVLSAGDGHASVHFPIDQTLSPQSAPTSRCGISRTAFTTPAKLSYTASAVVVGGMRSLLSVPSSNVAFQRLQAV